MYRIMIVEDDEAIAGAIAQQLNAWGMEAYVTEHFQNVLQEFAEVSPQLVLLDIALPFYNGYHWCTEIRKLSKVPIVFLSSASDNMNIVMAMNMGGDDFIAKPFDFNVLLAKMQALLRRTYDFSGESSVVSCGEVILNTADASLLYQGEKLELSKNEYPDGKCDQAAPEAYYCGLAGLYNHQKGDGVSD